MENNNGSTFYNRGVGKSFKHAMTTSLVALNPFVCSEVTIINSSGGDLMIYDSGNFADANSLLIGDGESITMRGVSNSDEISAKMVTGSGDIYYRSQPFGFMIH